MFLFWFGLFVSGVSVLLFVQKQKCNLRDFNSYNEKLYSLEMLSCCVANQGYNHSFFSLINLHSGQNLTTSQVFMHFLERAGPNTSSRKHLETWARMNSTRLEKHRKLCCCCVLVPRDWIKQKELETFFNLSCLIDLQKSLIHKIPACTL